MTSGIFPKLKRKGLLELEFNDPFSSEEESSLGLVPPSPNDGNEPDFLAKILLLSLGFLSVVVVVVVVGIRDELDVRVGAIGLKWNQHTMCLCKCL